MCIYILGVSYSFNVVYYTWHWSTGIPWSFQHFLSRGCKAVQLLTTRHHSIIFFSQSSEFCSHRPVLLLGGCSLFCVCMEEQTHLHSTASNSHAHWKQIKFLKQLSMSMPCGEHRLLSGFFFKSNKQTVKWFWPLRLALQFTDMKTRRKFAQSLLNTGGRDYHFGHRWQVRPLTCNMPASLNGGLYNVTYVCEV
jgi:hypothetical protein